MLDLAHIRALADAATGGPWTADTDRFAVVTPDRRALIECLLDDGDTREDPRQALRNMEFIAAARELVPAMADEIERLREHAHICSDLLDANEALGHSLTSARGEIERLRRRVAELEADPNDVRLPDQAKPLCSDMHTEPGMRGFWLCKLNPGHGGHHMSGDKWWPNDASGEAVRAQ